jgi:hypothetical protein
MSTNQDLIGRDDINDLEAILAVTNRDRDEVIHAVADNAEAIFTWDYEKGQRPALNRLYEKAKVSMWNGETDLPWDTEVDQEAVAMANAEAQGGIEQGMDLTGSPLEKWSEKEWLQLGVEFQNWSLSQFMHGEQGALIATAKIVQTVPDIDSKFYAATQVMDEARHVEAYSRLLHDKFELAYPITHGLSALLEQGLSDSRWDMTYLTMQILIEGLALAAFQRIRDQSKNPLAAAVNAYVMQDEARHVAFGRIALRDYYPQLSDAERSEREEFVVDACWHMRDRFNQLEVWQRLGLPIEECLDIVDRSEAMKLFRSRIFSRIVPTVRDIGLWGQRVQEAFAAMGAIEFAGVDAAALLDNDARVADEFDARLRLRDVTNA